MLRDIGSLLLIAALVHVAAGQSAQAAPPAAQPASEQAVESEFLELQQLLDQMSHSFGASRKFCAPDPGSVLAARLALFPRRFGIDPRTAPPWRALEAKARLVLQDAGDRGHPETGEIQDVSAQMDRYVLLDLIGSTEEARKILASVSTVGADGCIWCTAENSVVVNQRRSEEAERRGDKEAALRFLHDSALDIVVISKPEAGDLPGGDLLLVRYGLLLLQTRHEDLGLLVLQDLVRRRPESIGGRLAQAELTSREALGGVPSARVLFVGCGAETQCLCCSVIGVCSMDDPTSVLWIAARLPRRNDSECTRTVAFDPAAFEEARAPLKDAVARRSLDALTLLNALPGGAEPSVDSFLQAAAAFTEHESAPLIAADKRLRWLHGGGPQHAIPLGRCDWQAFAEDWKAWRKDTGTRVRSAH